MNKQNAKDYLPLVQALADGKTIQLAGYENNWSDLDYPDFRAAPNKYRIKPEPHPAESWPVDTKILVRNSEADEWNRRYFAKYENGLLHFWVGGCTSWSSCGTTVTWNFFKLAENDDGQG